jgi:hypothetical protein
LQVSWFFNYKNDPHVSQPSRLVFKRVLLGTSLLLLSLSAVLGFLNTNKVKTLRTEQGSAIAAHEAAENVRATQRKQPRGGEANAAAANAKTADSAARAVNAEAELAKAQKENAALQTKLQTSESQLAELQKKVQELAPNAAQPTTSEGPSVTELQAQLDDARQQLDSAEREKFLLADKTQAMQPRSPQAVQERVQRRNLAVQIGVHGTVLAVNQAYNFVVLSLGEHQGVETNAEMVVVRDGTLIGKIRVSSVEPSTAIGDIIGSSLPRGGQVQTGDTVIYAGTSW